MTPVKPVKRVALRSLLWAAALILASCQSGPQPAPVKAELHTVRAGESVAAIASRYGVSVDDIAEYNGLENPERIYPGERLWIPGASTSAGSGRQETSDGAMPSTAIRPPELPRSVPSVKSCREAEPAPSDLAVTAAGFSWPVDGVVVAHFGKVEGILHTGIDIAAPEGTPVWAAAKGEVMFASEQPGYGLLIILAHPSGQATVYARNAELCVKQGDTVERGQVIARVGASGRGRSPYLYFELRQGAEPENPRRWLP